MTILIIYISTWAREREREREKESKRECTFAYFILCINKENFGTNLEQFSLLPLPS